MSKLPERAKAGCLIGLQAVLLLASTLTLVTPVRAADTAIRYLDQGSKWTPKQRDLYYRLDQGSQLIALAWIKALKQANGKAFLDGSLARYGFLPMEDPARSQNLPIGFATNFSDRGPIVGLACAACHTRQIDVDKTRYRIDGGPAIIDFAGFISDLDAAMSFVRSDEATFKAFAADVLGPKASDENAVRILRTEVDLWWIRYHTFIGRSLPKDRLWGPARLDAISLIYNRVAGLDVGPPPTYLLPQNIEAGVAPVRYPFLWNSSSQEITQWTGFAANGNNFYGLTRNLGQEYGVFGTLHPQKTTGTFTIFDRNYIAENSANIAGIEMAEQLLREMGRPPWPWSLDRSLAAKGELIFLRPRETGGCAECHGEAPGKVRDGAGGGPTLKTPVVVVGTDTRAWQVALRQVDTGSMEGASIPGLVEPLGKRDGALALLRALVVGAVGDYKKALPEVESQTAKIEDPKARIHAMAKDKIGLGVISKVEAVKKRIGLGPEMPPPLVVNGYEARILPGIWAAAPYLHNGSVPTLADLLKPAADRPKSFKVGTTYDPQKVGLSPDQTSFNFTQTTTGCEDLASGDSNCGHEYGTRLPPDEKNALLEYLKSL